MRILFPFLILSGLGAGLALNSNLWSAPAGLPSSTPAQLTARVGVLGASASAGVGAGHPLAAYLAASLPADAEVIDEADPDLSRSPRTRGESAVQALLEAEPTLVVAVDFVFWFGHTSRLARGRRDDVEQALALLDRFTGRVVVGDLATLDASELPAAQRPGAEERAALNARIVAWAKERANASVISLSGAQTLEPEWLQEDGFHPNEAGLAELARRSLAAAGLDSTGWSFDPARLEAASSGPTRLRVEVVDERGTPMRDGTLQFSFGTTGPFTRSGFDRARLDRWRELADPLPLVDANPFERDDLPTELPPGGIDVWADVPGHLPTDRVPVLLHAGRDTSIRLVAPDPHPLEVRAFDSATGDPIAGVLVVSLTELERRGLDPRWSVPIGIGAGARTSSQGRARLRRLAPRPQRLELHRSGYALRRAEPVAVDGSLALPLHPLETDTRASIRVAGPDGDALEGAAVGLVVAGAESARWARVGADGLARFGGLPAGTALVHLPDWLALRRARGWHSADAGLSEVRAQLDRRALHLEPGAHAEATLGFLSDADDGGTLAGSVRGLDGEPVPRAGVLVQPRDATFGIAALTDAGGHFEISGLPPGAYRLEAGGTHQNVKIERGATRITITWVTARPDRTTAAP